MFPLQNLLPVSDPLQTPHRRRLDSVELSSYFSKQVTPPANGSDDARGIGIVLTRMVRFFTKVASLVNRATVAILRPSYNLFPSTETAACER
jgi:hypothetical protein